MTSNIYEKPSIELIEMDVEQIILTGSTEYEELSDQDVDNPL